MKRALGLICAGALGLMTSTSDAQAGGFTPWGTATGDGVIALSPYFFVGADGTFQISPYAFFGVTDHFDVLGGFSITAGPGANGELVIEDGAIELMPRGIINDYAIFAAHVFWTPTATDANGDTVINDSVDLALEFHGVAATEGRFTFTYNAFWGFNVGPGGFANGGLGLILVPEYTISDRVSAFVEVNPGFDFGAGDLTGDGDDDIGWGIDVVPGITVILDEEGNHSLTPAAVFSIAGADTSVTFGLLYWGAFQAAGGSAKAKQRARMANAFDTDFNGPRLR